ncbi:MAG TPA: PQQ-binding-like beta-propeller repeat protein [Mycobacteriales bacterium]|jgi:hypothetical protein
MALARNAAAATAATLAVALVAPVPRAAAQEASGGLAAYVIPDLTGGIGSHDLVLVRGGGSVAAVEVRNAAGGALRWRDEVPPAHAVLPLLTPGGEWQLALAGTTTETVDVPPAAAVSDVTLSVRARDAAGDAAWSWEATGSATTSPAAVTVRDLPELVGVQHAVEHDRVVVMLTDADLPRTEALPASTTVEVVTLFGGEPVTLGTASGDGTALPRALVCGDLTGDGTDDVLLVVPEAGGAGRIDALDGETGEALWSAAVADPLTAEVTGVGGDVLVADGGAATASVLDGAGGTVRWTAPAEEVAVAGDAVMLRNGGTVESRSTAGAVRWRRTAPGSGVAPAGDVDADGRDDVRTLDGSVLAFSDGRTLGRSTGTPLLDDADGRPGDDFVSVTPDRARVESARTLAWTRALPGAGAPWSLAADRAVRYDRRCTGVLVAADDGAVELLDGRTGRTRWRLAADGTVRRGDRTRCPAGPPSRPLGSRQRADRTIPSTGMPPLAPFAAVTVAAFLALARNARARRCV